MAEPYAPLLSRKKLLGAIEETTSGTSAAASISAALGFAVYDAKMVPDGWYGEGTRMPQGNYLGQAAAVAGKKTGTLTFRCELRYGDDGGTSVQALKLLTGCGYVLSTATYVPTSSMASRKTWTFKLWEDGRLKVLYGAAGTATLEWTAGGRLFANFTFRGNMDTAVADVALPAQTALNSAPWVGRAMTTLTLAATVIPHVNRVSIDLGNTVVEREHVTAATGVSHFFVSERAPKITIDTEARLVANYDTFGKFAAATLEALSMVVTNGTNTLTIAAPKTQRLSIGDDDRGGRLIDTLELGCQASSGDDELTFTPG